MPDSLRRHKARVNPTPRHRVRVTGVAGQFTAATGELILINATDSILINATDSLEQN